jgi:predicted transcriptional regulator
MTALPRSRVLKAKTNRYRAIVMSIGHDMAMASTSPTSTDDDRHWTLLTNHGRLLLLIAQEPDVRIRDLAAAAGVTERTAQAIVTDLEHAGYISKERSGRRNTYTVNRKQPFRHRAESGHKVGELIDVFTEHH